MPRSRQPILDAAQTLTSRHSSPEIAPPCLERDRVVLEFSMVDVEDLKALSKPEKFLIMEILWRDLSSDDSTIPSPKWHEDALKEASERHANGKAAFSDWTEAKVRIRNAVL